MSTSDFAKGALAWAWASSGELKQSQREETESSLPQTANQHPLSEQPESVRAKDWLRGNSVATTVQDQTDLAKLNVEPMLPLDQSSEGEEGAQVAEEKTEMDLAAAARSWQVMLAVEKSLDPGRVGAEVCQEPAWPADVVV